MSDAQWERLRPFLPVSNRRCGRWRDHRQVIDGILHRVRTGVQWRDLPERFDPWKTVYERHRLWSADGTWERLLQQVQAAADAAGEIDWDISVDSTILRAHQHAAGARTGPRLKGGRSPRTPGRNPVAEPARPPGGGSAGGEGLGRSRGGFRSPASAKGHGGGRPPGFNEERYKKRNTGQVLADKAYSSRAIRDHLSKRGIRVVIPVPADQRGHRLRRGSRGGRPPIFDRAAYKQRNTVERCINRLKQWRGIATRDEKTATIYLAGLHVAGIFLWSAR
ncbi:IS5 family transposase [Streptomyces sp. APSN-46.1]|nr:IS5 family transposase [Streptomyces sp. APSN-46.1]MCJ1676860.1 IS5 family transposase [Streptomyces sp. APSN-46.1]